MSDRRSMGDPAVKAALLILVVAQIASSTKVVKRNIRSTRSVDLTRVPGAVGEDVVDGCITALEDIDYFSNDLGLLKRLALVLTDFGDDIDGSGDGSGFGSGMGPSAGIWNISDNVITVLEGNQALVDTIATLLAINPRPVDQFDANIPINSAFLMRIYLSITTDNAVLATIMEQAQWFAAYLSGNATEFIEKVIQFESENNCVVQKMDMWFLIDDTGSIGQENFDKQIRFIAKLTSNFPIDIDMVRVGISTFGGVEMSLDDTSNFGFLNMSLFGIPFASRGASLLGTAIDNITAEFETGARPPNEGVPRVAFIFADTSEQPVLASADTLRAAGVTVFAVGVGDYNEEVLRMVASDPDTEHFFEFNQFPEQALSDVLADAVCSVAFIAPDKTTIDIDVLPGNFLYATVVLPALGSAILVFEVTTPAGEGVVYFSKDTRTPNSAVHGVQVNLLEGITFITLSDTLGGLELEDVTRAKRNVGDTLLHIAIESTGSEPLQGSFGGNTQPANHLECSEIITIVFNQTTLDELNAALGDVLYVSQNPSDKPQDVAANCQVVVSAFTVLSFNITDCNPAVTQNFTAGLYQAIYTVWRQPAMDLSRPVQRYKDYCKTYECVFDDELLLDSLSIVPEIMKLEQGEVITDGSFTLGTDLCTTSDCSMPLAPGSQVFVPDDVYVKISLTDLAAGIDNFYVIMNNCWATKEANPNSEPSYGLIYSKSEAGGDVMIIRNSASRYALFKFESFVWTNYTATQQTLSVHCDVIVCDHTLTDCTTVRKRRSAREAMQGKRISSHHLIAVQQTDGNCDKNAGYCSDICIDEEQGLQCACRKGRALSRDRRTCYDSFTIIESDASDKVIVVSSRSDWMLAALAFACAITLSLVLYILYTRPRK